MLKGLLRNVAICGLLLTLAACQTNAPRSGQGSDSMPKASMENVTKLLAQSETSPSPQKEYLMIEAARQLHQLENSTWARNLLVNIDSSQLDAPHFVAYTRLYGELAMQDDEFFLAQRILTNPRLEQQWQRISEADAIKLRQLRANVFFLLGENDKGIRERLLLQPLLRTDEARLANQEGLWQILMTMPFDELQQRANQSSDPTQRGWFSLAAIVKSSASNLERQQQMINDWVARWPTHPASLNLPHDLQQLQKLIRERPQHLAILLPQQGKLGQAGRAIIDGFMANYYRASNEGMSVPELTVYDSSESKDIFALYQQAVDSGAGMIIGPLDKDAVTRLSELDSLPVPTLALNYSLSDSEPPQGLFQFGLAAEDEARQAARRAWREGYRHPLILTLNSSWGQRSAEAFTEQWTALGGRVSEYKQFTGHGDFSDVIQKALLIDESHERENTLQRLFGQNLEFEPRRRGDIDMIFLVATPIQARQVKPTLAFHYASKLPIFATSHVYSGIDNPKADQDINGVRFPTLPWRFEEDNLIKSEVEQQFKPAPAYLRLYAMGADAYKLYPRLLQMQQFPETRLFGDTGVLQLNTANRIEREQVWAVIRDGKAEPLPSLLDQPTED